MFYWYKSAYLVLACLGGGGVSPVTCCCCRARSADPQSHFRLYFATVSCWLLSLISGLSTKWEVRNMNGLYTQYRVIISLVLTSENFEPLLCLKPNLLSFLLPACVTHSLNYKVTFQITCYHTNIYHFTAVFCWFWNSRELPSSVAYKENPWSINVFCLLMLVKKCWIVDIVFHLWRDDNRSPPANICQAAATDSCSDGRLHSWKWSQLYGALALS